MHVDEAEVNSLASHTGQLAGCWRAEGCVMDRSCYTYTGQQLEGLTAPQSHLWVRKVSCRVLEKNQWSVLVGHSCSIFCISINYVKWCKTSSLNGQEMPMTDGCNPIQIWLTGRKKESIIPGESQTLHCSPVVGDGITTNPILDIPNADEAPVTITATRCWCHSLDRKK